jgi:rhodanese-related sulfurtransferase
MTTNTIDARKASDWLASGEAVLIDVREPDEYRSGHIPYALSLPLSSLPGALTRTPIAPDIKIIAQCLKGGRGAQACAALAAHGLPNALYNLEGGITAWSTAGLPVVGGATTGVSIFRQVQMIVGGLILIAILAGLTGARAGFYMGALFASMLVLSGASGWCGLAMLLRHMPWNRS